MDELLSITCLFLSRHYIIEQKCLLDDELPSNEQHIISFPSLNLRVGQVRETIENIQCYLKVRNT